MTGVVGFTRRRVLGGLTASLLAGAARAQTDPLPPREAKERDDYCDVPGGRLWYRLTGQGTATPLILIHGGPAATSRSLEPYTALGSARMVVLYDQLGCGRSDQPAEKAYYTIERFCAGLLALQDKLALPQAALLGHGTGGWIAQEYAIRRPKRVAALILAGTTTSAAAKEAAERAAAAQLGAGLAKVLIEDRREDPLYAEAMNTYRRRFVYRAETVPSWLTELEQAMAANVSRRLMVGDNRFDIQGTFGRFDAKPRLRQIQAATFVMTGEHDIAGPEAAAALADSIPHAELKILPGLSHLAHIEDAAAATATVGTFLARVDDRRRR